MDIISSFFSPAADLIASAIFPLKNGSLIFATKLQKTIYNKELYLHVSITNFKYIYNLKRKVPFFVTTWVCTSSLTFFQVLTEPRFIRQLRYLKIFVCEISLFFCDDRRSGWTWRRRDWRGASIAQIIFFALRRVKVFFIFGLELLWWMRAFRRYNWTIYCSI